MWLIQSSYGWVGIWSFCKQQHIFPMRDFLKFFTFNLRIVIVWLLKFRYCEKATKFEKISHLVLKLLSNVKSN